MGMYTQVYGILCAKSNGNAEDYQRIKEEVEKVETRYATFHVIDAVENQSYTKNRSVWIAVAFEIYIDDDPLRVRYTPDDCVIRDIKNLRERISLEGRIEVHRQDETVVHVYKFVDASKVLSSIENMLEPTIFDGPLANLGIIKEGK